MIDSKRIPYLDGLRAISIMLVMFAHGLYSMPFSDSYFYLVAANSTLGVITFFVISGFLITSILLREYEKTNTINLKKFYIRRSFRIFPIFYVYISVVLILVYGLHVIKIADMDLFFSSIYLANYKSLIYHLLDLSTPVSPDHWFIGHLWTLSLEEQFYLLWPFLIVILGLTRTKKMLYVIIFIYPLVRIITYYSIPAVRGQIGMMLHTMGDSIFFGCFAAFLQKEYKEKIFVIADNIKKNKRYLIYIIIFIAMVLSPVLSFFLKGTYTVTVGYSIYASCMTMIILYILNSEDPIFDFLNNKILIHIGVLSYSLYVWQQLFLTPKHQTAWGFFPVNFICCYFIALVSYHCIEKPFLKLRDRIS